VTDSTTESNISSSTSRNNKSWENTMSHSGKKTTSSRFSIDTFFHKTNTLPKLYYLPIDEKIAQERKKQLVSQRERSTSSTAATIDSTSVAPSLISSSR
jgi:hypothetical protein